MQKLIYLDINYIWSHGSWCLRIHMWLVTIVAFEGDLVIFNVNMSSFFVVLITYESDSHTISIAADDEHIQKVAKHLHISKFGWYLICAF